MRLIYIGKMIKLGSVPIFMLCAASVVSAAPQPPASVTARIERLEAHYGISFRYAGFPENTGVLRFVEVAPEHYSLLDGYLDLFDEEISKYPPGFFRDRDIRGIGIVRRLFMGRTPAQGLYSPAARVMFFEISRFRRNKAQQRHSIHHEIFHMMTQNLPDHPLLDEAAWTAFHEPGFSYGKQPRPSGPNPYNRHAPNPPGFVTYYAMESAIEDQAEIFACLMLEPHRRLVLQWMANDPVMEKKVRAIQAFVQDYHPVMDTGYWKLGGN